MLIFRRRRTGYSRYEPGGRQHSPYKRCVPQAVHVLEGSAAAGAEARADEGEIHWSTGAELLLAGERTWSGQEDTPSSEQMFWLLDCARSIARASLLKEPPVVH